MNDKLKHPKMDALFEAILLLRSMEECYRFFEDLCTVSELKSMEQRFDVANMLAEGRVYSDIAAETGASSATISRVNRALNYGADGYKLVLERKKTDGI
ncbi:YerC/YecD family TrpR-related protein [Oscillospiraceae bacterium OttesenSCG-928-G22]|nr:YerC/YecD family TrpR-related protein [Oscillospiraceae bacterium OttesenSCG-928-G22]